MGLTSYQVNFQVFGNPDSGDNAGQNGIAPPENSAGDPNLNSTFQDGTSNTILFAEAYSLRPGGAIRGQLLGLRRMGR